MSSKNTSNSGIGCFGVLTIVFVVLKLKNLIDWSWVWVLAPCWGPIVLVIVLACLAGLLLKD